MIEAAGVSVRSGSIARCPFQALASPSRLYLKLDKASGSH